MMPEGAVHIDTTPYTLDEVVDQVVAARSRRAGRGASRDRGSPHRRWRAALDRGVRAPRTRLLTAGRFVPAAIIRAWWDLEIHGAERRARGPGRW